MSTESEIAERTDRTPARGTVRTVKPALHGRADTEMHTIGLLYAAILAILLVPLVPFAVVVWVAWRAGRVIRSFVGENEKSSPMRSRRGRVS